MRDQMKMLLTLYGRLMEWFVCFPPKALLLAERLAFPFLFNEVADDFVDGLSWSWKPFAFNKKNDLLSKLFPPKVWKVENEFYEFAETQFKAIKSALLNSNRSPTLQNFHYDKIRPKNKDVWFFYYAKWYISSYKMFIASF